MDHPDGFWVYQVQGPANWSLLQALATALTIRQCSCQTTVLDLYYFYKKAVRDEPINRVHKGKLQPLIKSDSYICTFEWDLVAQALDYWMDSLEQKPLTFVVTQPPDDKTTPVSRVSTVPVRMTEMRLAKMERLWLEEAHFNVVMPCETETGWKYRRLLHSLEDLDQEALHAYASEIRSLESDLFAKNVSMMSLSLEETHRLLRKTAIERAEHMNRSGFGFDFVDPRGSHPPPSRLSRWCDDKKAKQVLLAPLPYHTTGTASVPRPSHLERSEVLRIKQELVSPEPTARAGTTVGTGESKAPSHQEAKDGSSEAQAISISSETSGGDSIDPEVSKPTHGRGDSTFAHSANTSSSPVKEKVKADAARTTQSTQAHASSNTVSASPSQPSQWPSRSHLDVFSYASRAIVRPRPNDEDKLLDRVNKAGGEVQILMNPPIRWDPKGGKKKPKLDEREPFPARILSAPPAGINLPSNCDIVVEVFPRRIAKQAAGSDAVLSDKVTITRSKGSPMMDPEDDGSGGLDSG